jgi:Ser-tRNA(Ala) deacylase AlaX
MTKKIFWQDPYLTSLDTRVATVGGQDVTIEETIFYAESGGQESDSGTIGGKIVYQARNSGKAIIYRLEPTHGLQQGDRVNVKIDWIRRYRLMRLHFAAEIVLELFYKNFPGIQKVGAHIAADKARIDFLKEESITPFLAEFGREAQDLIDADLPIVSAFSDEEAERRYWMVEGFAQVPCGGTHLKRTGEVGKILLKRKNIGKGKERVEIFLSDAA